MIGDWPVCYCHVGAHCNVEFSQDKTINYKSRTYNFKGVSNDRLELKLT